MNREEKFLKLVEIARGGDDSYPTKPKSCVRLTSLDRLVDGDLSHIGDAIINERVVLTGGKHFKAVSFDGHVDYYTVEKPTIMIGNIECVKGETEAPTRGTRYYTLGECNEVVSHIWAFDTFDEHYLAEGKVWLTEEAAEAVLNAFRQLLKGGLNENIYHPGQF